ncbi:RusA family crossover junction endodeoxyribonuclease [Chitinophaga agrisoli]|uniref:RusA family crossover junction endodeoxyribonuclease n=1 Tax=Chitinophaga agrisoli TaxID=2607653 RepID=A0A5B2VVU6_9BACT|nr:RusA family crossover junction endodeoxyribonuclease [Chitinophaga agrisoli]KAA2242854.1 RusA family crossover junction endodeoxyribonuclease [Chitinophaga agrisoli]
MKQTIYGTVPSKSNSYRIITINGHASLAKRPALARYEKDFYIQCNHYRDAGIDGYFELHLDVYYPNQRADLDNSLKVVLDCLQRVKAIKNDNKAVGLFVRKFLDKANPRIEFQLITV